MMQWHELEYSFNSMSLARSSSWINESGPPDGLASSFSSEQDPQDHNSLQPLYRVPAELIYEITSYVVDVEQIFENHFLDDTPSHLDEGIRVMKRDLRSLSLSCRYFRAPAQKLLCKNIAVDATYLPMDGPGYRRRHVELYDVTNREHFYLLRTLAERPDLSRCVRHFVFHLHASARVDSRTSASTQDTEFVRRFARKIIVDSKLYKKRKKSWQAEFSEGLPAAYCGLLIAVVPQLEHLSLRGHDYQLRTSQEFSTVLGHCFGGDISDVGAARRIPVRDWLQLPRFQLYQQGLSGIFNFLKNLKSLRISGSVPTRFDGLRYLPKITRLDLSFPPWCHNYRTFGYNDLPWKEHINVRHLRVDARFQLIQHDTGIGHFYGFLERVLPTFSHLDTVEFYDKEIRTPDFKTALQQLNLNPSLNHARFRRLIEHVPSNIRTLTLPSNVWKRRRSPQFATCLKKFRLLQHLVAPRMALINNNFLKVPDAEPTPFHPFHHLKTPMNVLPYSLQTLKILDADEETFWWLKDIFTYQHKSFLGLESIELVYSNDDAARYFENLVLEEVEFVSDVQIQLIFTKA